MKIAAIGDIHCRENNGEQVKSLFTGIQDEAELLIIAGDLTDSGLPEEANALLEVLKGIRIPIIAILGNHDHEANQPEEVKRILTDGGIKVLDGTVFEFGDIGFVGTKGFCGGFGKQLVLPFGENSLKKFIRVGIDEAIELEKALARLECKIRIAILHYSPIRETLEGESPELYPFLGTSRLADAIDRQGADMILHGHAHHGSPEGVTPGAIPVHNVSRFVQSKYGEKPYLLIDTDQIIPKSATEPDLARSSIV